MYFMLYVFIVLLVGTCLLNMCVAALGHVVQSLHVCSSEHVPVVV